MSEKTRQVTNAKRLLSIVEVGHARYIAVGRVLPFLSSGDKISVEYTVNTPSSWVCILRPFDGTGESTTLKGVKRLAKKNKKKIRRFTRKR